MAFLSFCKECERNPNLPRQTSLSANTTIQPYVPPAYNFDQALHDAAVNVSTVQTPPVYIPRGKRPRLRIYFAFPRTEPKQPFGVPDFTLLTSPQGKVTYPVLASDWSWGYYLRNNLNWVLRDDAGAPLNFGSSMATVVDLEGYSGEMLIEKIYRRNELIDRDGLFYLPWHYESVEEITRCHGGLIRKAEMSVGTWKMKTSSQVGLPNPYLNRFNVYDNLTSHDGRGHFSTVTEIRNVFTGPDLYFPQTNYYLYLDGDSIYSVSPVTYPGTTLSGFAPNGGIWNFPADPFEQGGYWDLLNLHFLYPYEQFGSARGFFWLGSAAGPGNIDMPPLTFNRPVTETWWPVVGEHRSYAIMILDGV